MDVDVDDIQGDASKVDTRPTTHTYLDAGRPVEDDLEEWVGPQQPWNPWRPFRDAYDFQLAHWFLEDGRGPTLDWEYPIPLSGSSRDRDLSDAAKDFRQPHVLQPSSGVRYCWREDLLGDAHS